VATGQYKKDKMTQATNSNLHRAKKAKNDEFYTQLSDIAKELVYYTKHFKGKVVLCNCDDPMESNFVKFFSLKFEDLGLKKLIATSYVEPSKRRRKKPSVLIYEGDKNNNRVPDPAEFTERLIGDGDFRSEECIALLQEADIVVTNPPFSLFREYVDQLVEYKKKFLIIGNMNAITYKEIFTFIKDGKIWLGRTHPKTFSLPDGAEQSFGNICWFTNLDVTKRHEDITLYRKYSRKLYPKYDNYKAIEVSKVTDIPMDYVGVMGVPITFLGKHNPDQFEIVDINPHFFTLVEQGLPKPKQLKLAGCNDPYARILIRNKRVEE
jgi:hypothetical protein